MKKTTQTWIFYGKDRNGIITIHAIKQCKNPERTAEYKEMLYVLFINWGQKDWRERDR